MDSQADGSKQSSLADLLKQAQGGDAAARDRLFEKCRAYVNVVAHAHVESWLQAKIDASDLVQQTLLDAYRGLDRFRGTTEGEWLAWLRRILSHNATDYVRQYRTTDKRRVNRELPLGVGAGASSQGFAFDPSDGGESPSQVVMRHERELEVATAISQLSPEYREVIMLRNLQRLPFEEVGRRMGRTGPAVQMLWLRALRKLQSQLER